MSRYSMHGNYSHQSDILVFKQAYLCCWTNVIIQSFSAMATGRGLEQTAVAITTSTWHRWGGCSTLSSASSCLKISNGDWRHFNLSLKYMLNCIWFKHCIKKKKGWGTFHQRFFLETEAAQRNASQYLALCRKDNHFKIKTFIQKLACTQLRRDNGRRRQSLVQKIYMHVWQCWIWTSWRAKHRFQSTGSWHFRGTPPFKTGWEPDN